MVFEIAQNVDIVLIASGGVSTWRDAVEYIMAGASLIGVCTVGHLQGSNRYAKIIEDLEKYFEEKQTTLDEIRGLALRKVEERKNKGWSAITTPIPPEVIGEKCTACGKCERSCIYEAITVDDIAVIDKNTCYGCGLCVDVCPERAIKSLYYLM
jgi:ferredoxin